MDRHIIAQLAAHEKWAKTPDRAKATAPARAALAAKWEREVDPDGTMKPADRAKAAENARRAFYLRLALKSAQARKARAKADAIDAEIAKALAETA